MPDRIETIQRDPVPAERNLRHTAIVNTPIQLGRHLVALRGKIAQLEKSLRPQRKTHGYVWLLRHTTK